MYFSQVFGVLSVNSSIITLPAGSDEMEMSKNTRGREIDIVLVPLFLQSSTLLSNIEK